MSNPEPFRIRSVEPIRQIPPEARAKALTAAGYNLFRLASHDVFIDLLTDSGTGAMSAAQWAALHQADESYAGSESFERFADAVRRVTGYAEVIPTHQGRAAERILCETLLRRGDVVVSNGLFDTTRANVERVGARGIDLPSKAALCITDPDPLKGGIDLERLAGVLASEPVRAVVLTCTSNAFGGHPVSVANVAGASRLCRQRDVPLFIDAARFAENAGLLRRRDPGCAGATPREIARSIFALADGCLMSAKKNGLAHIGGFLALRSRSLAERLRDNLIVTEGFETYGGLAGRDLDAIAIGLEEALAIEPLEQRLGQVERLGARLDDHGVPIAHPAGGHAVYVDAATALPHLTPGEFPGHAFACELYLEGAVRGCEIGSLMFEGRPPGGPELTRLAVPWRTYTDEHLTYVAESAAAVLTRAEAVRGLRVVSAPTTLRHFRAILAPLDRASAI